MRSLNSRIATMPVIRPRGPWTKLDLIRTTVWT